MNLGKTFLIAHRGESYEAPENTLAAINLAWKNGAKAVEIDVQLTADNQIVVIHDENTSGTGDKNKIVKKSSLKELKEVDVGLFKGEIWKNERIPTLKEVFETIPKTGKLIIEIKSNEKIILPLVAEIQNSHLKTNQIEIIAFNFDLLVKIKKRIPEYSMLWLLGSGLLWSKWHILTNRIISKLLSHHLDGVDVFAGNKINKKIIKNFQKHGLLVYVWTVNNPLKAQQLINSDIDALTTDQPAWIKNKLEDF